MIVSFVYSMIAGSPPLRFFTSLNQSQLASAARQTNRDQNSFPDDSWEGELSGRVTFNERSSPEKESEEREQRERA